MIISPLSSSLPHITVLPKASLIKFSSSSSSAASNKGEKAYLHVTTKEVTENKSSLTCKYKDNINNLQVYFSQAQLHQVTCFCNEWFIDILIKGNNSIKKKLFARNLKTRSYTWIFFLRWCNEKLRELPLVVSGGPPQNHDDTQYHREQKVPERIVHPQFPPVLHDSLKIERNKKF